MAVLSSILVWRIPWTEEPGGLQSIGSQSWTRLKLLSTQAHKYPRGIRASNVDGGVGTRPMESETFKQFPNTNNTK